VGVGFVKNPAGSAGMAAAEAASDDSGMTSGGPLEAPLFPAALKPDATTRATAAAHP
jgi:hypothetical protein